MKKIIASGLLMAGMTFGASVASANVIAVFGDFNSSVSSLTSNLTSLGHTVTNLGVNINQDLSGYDSVWGVSAFDPLSATENSYLASYLQSGGGLYLTGERPCCEVLNGSLTTFVNSVVVGGGIQVGNLGDQGSSATINSNVVGNLASAPNAVSTWFPIASGGIAGLGGISSENIFATSNNTGTAVAAAWDMDDLNGNAGRMVLMMDVNWLSGTSQIALLENIEVYLSGATVGTGVPAPAPLTLLGIGLLGLGIARKRKVA